MKAPSRSTVLLCLASFGLARNGFGQSETPSVEPPKAPPARAQQSHYHVSADFKILGPNDKPLTPADVSFSQNADFVIDYIREGGEATATVLRIVPKSKQPAKSSPHDGQGRGGKSASLLNLDSPSTPDPDSVNLLFGIDPSQHLHTVSLISAAENPDETYAGKTLLAAFKGPLARSSLLKSLVYLGVHGYWDHSGEPASILSDPWLPCATPRMSGTCALPSLINYRGNFDEWNEIGSDWFSRGLFVQGDQGPGIYIGAPHGKSDNKGSSITFQFTDPSVWKRFPVKDSAVPTPAPAAEARPR